MTVADVTAAEQLTGLGGAFSQHFTSSGRHYFVEWSTAVKKRISLVPASVVCFNQLQQTRCRGAGEGGLEGNVTNCRRTFATRLVYLAVHSARCKYIEHYRAVCCVLVRGFRKLRTESVSYRVKALQQNNCKPARDAQKVLVLPIRQFEAGRDSESQ